MMTIPYYPVYPFGDDADDLTAISTTTTVDGTVSWQSGWTINYQQDLLTVDTAKTIPRGQTNQLMFDITQNIQQYWQTGTPEWITSAANQGSPFAYRINARVYYGSVVYENTEAGNTSTPGTDARWVEVSGTGNSFFAGALLDFPGPDAPANWAFTDGSAYSRTNYTALYAALTKVLAGTTTNGSAVVTGISSTAKLRAGCQIEGTGVPAATTILSVDSGTQITMSANATASGSPSLRFFYWGNGDGSTTFNIPNLEDQVTAGTGGSAYSFGSGLGQSGGGVGTTMTAEMLAQHQHDTPAGAGFIIGGASGIGYGSSGNQFGQYADTGGINGYSSQDDIPIVQPTTLVSKIIRLI